MSPTRASSFSVLFGSYNLLDLYASESDEELARYERIYEVIRGLDVDVLAVQEVIADDPDPVVKAALAGQRLCQLAEAVGMRCVLPGGQPALAVGNHRFHVGLLWRESITPVGGFRAYPGANVWHSVVKLPLDVGGVVVQHASYHAPPFGRYRRADEAERILSIMTRPDRPGQPGHRPPGLIGADWNAISADRVWREGWLSEDDREPGRWVLYDDDPYRDKPVHGDLVFQTRWTFDRDGSARFQADREPGEILYLGGLRDAAAVLNAPWETTVGHWPTDDLYGERRIDAVRVTEDVMPALVSYSVVSGASSADGPGDVDPRPRPIICLSWSSTSRP